MPERNSPHSPKAFHYWITLAFWSVVYVAGVRIADLGLQYAVMTDLRVLNVLGTLALIATVFLISASMRPRAGMLFASIALLTLLLIRFSFHGIALFSGAGFTNEVFIHLEWESFRVAWDEYRPWILAMLGALAVLAVAMLALSSRMVRPSRRISLLMLLPVVVIVAFCRQGLPEWMLVESLHAWYSPKRLHMPEAELQQWRDSGLVEVDLTRKSDLQARLPGRPRNLILLYIESGGVRVIEHPGYPGLMPNLARLMREHSLVPSVHASSFITIEGIVNSQCGTLFPFERGSESLVGFDATAEELPCLGDVLRLAGYRQSYLGGADLSFAGKGNFLLAHGYDKVVGQRKWAEQGLHQRPGTWGVSDADLFEQSLIELEALRNSEQPFNLTLLTIGTHLPGFAYAECQPYGSGNEVFLNALHCSDQLIHRWLTKLEAAGFMRDSLVVITGDHNIFPNPEMQRLFGNDATSDRRLPLIVLGDSAAAAVVGDGAGVDLAPTLLDLLEVTHNAEFALGRSLLRLSSARNYFPTRYMDIFKNQPIERKQESCNGRIAPTAPLNECSKDSLLTLLRMQNTAFSLPRIQLHCDRAERTRISIPDAPEEPMAFLVDGNDQIPRFSWMERTLVQPAPGLYAIAFDGDGNVLQRTFFPEDGVHAPSSAGPITGESRALLAAWRGSGPQSRPPAWFGGAPANGNAAARLFDGNGILAENLARERIGTDSIFILDSDSCAGLLGIE